MKNSILPKIIFESGWLLDDSVANLSKIELKQEALDEISNRLSEFQTAWNESGRPLLTAEKYADHGFDVMTHLHLMALQRQAHETVGNKIAWLTDWYRTIGDDYLKTWKAVSDDVRYAQLLKEISTDFRRL